MNSPSLILIEGYDELTIESLTALNIEQRIINHIPSNIRDQKLRTLDKRVLSESGKFFPIIALGTLGSLSLTFNCSKRGLDSLEVQTKKLPIENSYDLVIVGAGPSGASLAAHAEHAGLNYLWLGEPFSFWLYHILPNDLRSPAAASGINTPINDMDFISFAQCIGVPIDQPVSMPLALAYFNYFVTKQNLTPLPFTAEKVDYQDNSYNVQLRMADQYQTVKCRNLVWCAGLKGMENIPKILRQIPSKNFTHSSDTNIPNTLSKDYKIAVIGAGQSAAEHAILAIDSGAQVKLLIRDSNLIFRNLHSPGNHLYKWCSKNADSFVYRLPSFIQKRFLSYLLKGTTEPKMKLINQWDKLKIIPKFDLIQANVLSDGKLELKARSGQCEYVDHLILGTGYKYEINKIKPLSDLQHQIKSSDGFPLLDENCMSSVPGLFFGGYAAMKRIGPKCQFIAGSALTSKALMYGISQRLKHDN